MKLERNYSHRLALSVKNKARYFRVQKTLTLLLGLFLLNLFISCLDVKAGPQPEPDEDAPVRSGALVASGNLTYHGGPVLNSAHTVYFIYWLPSGSTVSTRYRSLVDGFMNNVAIDSGKTSNVYSSSTEYKNGNNQAVAYQVSFGGSVVDSSPFPASGCTNPTTTVCLTDSQIRDKLTTVMASQNWTSGFDKVYFFMLPKNVGSCYDGTNAHCSFVQYCGYHTYKGDAANPVLYSLIPYAMTNSSKCGSFSHPNGDEADSSINIISHEHAELMTDPLHTAWFNSDRREKADKCTWQFGQHVGWTAYGKYNQQIGTGKYYLQAQWSNQAGTCVLRGS